jgi:outer membrane biosynthesis protein TonB
MSKQQSRKKRRPRLQKPDTINIILGSLTLILLFVWGGLYWNESSQQSHIVNANGAALNEHAQLDEEELYGVVPEKTSPAVDGVPSTTDKTDKPAEQVAGKPGGSGEEAVLPEKETEKPTESDKTSQPVQTTKPTSTSKPNKDTVTKPNDGSAPKPKPKPTPELPSVPETETPISATEKYEQQIIQLQAKCTQDMNDVLAGAEKSVEQMDMSDPYAFQELSQKWMDGLTKVEATCSTKLQGIIGQAEKDNVEAETTEKWEQTFSDLMLQLQGQFEAKLLQLMGG